MDPYRSTLNKTQILYSREPAGEPGEVSVCGAVAGWRKVNASRDLSGYRAL